MDTNDPEKRFRRALELNREALEGKKQECLTAFQARRRRIVNVARPAKSGVFLVGTWGSPRD